MGRDIKILVVDDERDLLATMHDILESMGYRSEVAEDGLCALDLLKANNFNIAVVNIAMPKMNGIALVREIKRISPHTKIIMMTGYGPEHPLVEEALQEGVDRLLRKPFDISILLDLLKLKAP